MLSLDTEKEKVVGVLHDIIEDTNITYEYLLKNGFDVETEILEALKSVTRNEKETYEQFIETEALNPIGKRVKMADLQYNMDINRISIPSELDYKRIEKYKNARDILLQI
jgi:(p)ppGpp synthase/HD superfamily hydrolase